MRLRRSCRMPKENAFVHVQGHAREEYTRLRTFQDGNIRHRELEDACCKCNHVSHRSIVVW